MYLRSTKRRNADGSIVEYLQLAHNERSSDGGNATAKIIHNFGRADQLDRDSLVRLCRSIARVCGLNIAEPCDDVPDQLAGDLRLGPSKVLGEVLVIEALWEKFGIGPTLREAVHQANCKLAYERALLAMTANRLCQPESKLGTCERWLPEVYLPSCGGFDTDHFYQAMDLFFSRSEAVERAVFAKVAHLFNLEVDLVFYDTTTAAFHTDENDDDEGDSAGIRKFGHPKGGGWAPQVVIALAVTREGFPVRSWVFPGNTADVATVEKVKADLRDWQLGRVLFVGDAGMNSADNRRDLGRAFGKYLLASRISGLPEIEEQVLARRGRYQVISENLHAKEVVIGDGELRRRYILCYNPREAERQQHHRSEVVEQIRTELAKHRDQSATARWAADLLASSRTKRYLQVTKEGKIRLDQAAVVAAARLDGKWVLQTNDDTLSIEDAATGYKSLMIIERCFRTMKRAQIQLEPVHHRLADRITTHVKICVLALLIQRAAEHITGRTWIQMQPILRTLQATPIQAASHDFIQRSEASPDLQKLLTELDIPLPKKILAITPRPADTPTL